VFPPVINTLPALHWTDIPLFELVVAKDFATPLPADIIFQMKTIWISWG